MGEPFLGSEAVARGTLTRGRLSTGYVRLFRDVYVRRDADITAAMRARAGWLWSGRQGVVAGFAAAALHGSKWVDSLTVVDLIHDNRHPQAGIRAHGDRIEDDEISVIGGIPLTSAARTALDIGCWYSTTAAVAGIDALARATGIKAADVDLLAQRYSRRRGIVQARKAIALFDSGAQSPKESWLRIVLVQAGLPPPQTQIPISDESGDLVAYLDMGWEELKVAVEYDGDHHRTNRRQYGWDIRRSEMLQRRGWIVVRVVAGDRPADIIRRVQAARALRA
ncbi:hypothetical protein A5739_06775 [Mycobacterium colombiense]|uniref:hypothetical protein n=1 Tax=Mycobacterium colombiense TaxID=339268 RepID=UPI00096D498D|nr:hypothetical protein [Mycobacterium colombiense]OMB93885.1 hypothetical protein A5732_14800 [Mycobacterium colombiense]OMC33950.1 hypothetical protein A5739_06775 [Mycobacterium colombiense]